jgi:pSer/pThr/pTyr-binding forkhead associated (FHA) protein
MPEFILQVISGPAAGKSCTIAAGSTVRVGRSWKKADWTLDTDFFLSAVHFSVTYDGQECVLRDTGSSNGTVVNGVVTTETTISDGDEIFAGSSTFLACLVDSPASDAPQPSDQQDLLSTTLSLPARPRRKPQPKK